LTKFYTKFPGSSLSAVLVATNHRTRIRKFKICNDEQAPQNIYAMRILPYNYYAVGTFRTDVSVSLCTVDTWRRSDCLQQQVVKDFQNNKAKGPSLKAEYCIATYAERKLTQNKIAESIK
jgi:hypothetical protein